MVVQKLWFELLSVLLLRFEGPQFVTTSKKLHNDHINNIRDIDYIFQHVISELKIKSAQLLKCENLRNLSMVCYGNVCIVEMPPHLSL